MKILITGGAGFIGGHLTAALLERGDEVVIADNFSTGSRDNIRMVNGRLPEVVETDVSRDLETIRELIRKSDAVFHLAAAVGVELVVNDPVHTIQTNIDGSANVVKAAAEFDKRLFIASTSEVYGKSENDRFSETDDLLIGSPYHSRWSYACSKLLDEFYLMAYHQAAGLRGTVVRFFNTVGPRQTGKYGMVVPRFVANALQNKPLKIYGDGGQSRCFCHVSDVVRALLLLLDDDRSIGEIFNIGSDQLITIRELAELVIARLGSKSTLEYIPYEKAYSKGFEDMRRRKPATDKLQALVNWRAEKSLEEIIDDVAALMRG
ncbi:MAG: NAD-dependent epimerase/dehydratase family protein [Lentisphaerae bacterium]|nr:NAD-dependent epimerase/dehydratase family protein [Lentisphaerota bacterium]MBE6389147.1 NAD-dependent epimerase/dehydratase family protein [Lentisphaerota bacterium]